MMNNYVMDAFQTNQSYQADFSKSVMNVKSSAKTSQPNKDFKNALEKASYNNRDEKKYVSSEVEKDSSITREKFISKKNETKVGQSIVKNNDDMKSKKDVTENTGEAQPYIPDTAVDEVMANLVNISELDFDKIEEIMQKESLTEEDLSNLETLLVTLDDNVEISVSDKINIVEQIEELITQADVSIDEESEIFSSLETEISQLKQKLEDLEMIQDSVQVVINETAHQMNTNQAQKMTNEQSSMNTTENVKEEMIEEVKIDNEMQDHGDGKENESQSEDREFNLDTKVKVVNLQTNNIEQQQTIVPFNEVLEEKNSVATVETSNKVFSMLNINKENVLQQVVDNAKVVIADGKTEMTVQMKPENLGKLSLEIVSERGMMVAKFVAESQQVKEIIESSLPQLKDALESQGLNVKGFSVSVGDNSAQQQAYERGKSSKVRKQLMNSDSKEGITMVSRYEVKHSIVNPYQISDSSIEFTA